MSVQNSSATLTSPRPSPLPLRERRGRIEFNPTNNLATGFAGRVLENLKSSDCFSLSQRERVRVRENETNIFIGAAAL